MDPRHESYKESFLNQLITIINVYIQQNTDNFITQTHLQNQIHTICQQIYQYLGMQVDVNGILSKHNLLSVDIVLFPLISDAESNQILPDQDFKNLLNHMRLILQDNKQLGIQKKILHLLEKYQ